jgi:hypothetical protein
MLQISTITAQAAIIDISSLTRSPPGLALGDVYAVIT